MGGDQGAEKQANVANMFSLPLAAIGLEGKPARCGLDVSITFSDPAGTVNNARLHWGRNGAAMVYDLPSEARLEPETWGVGVLK